MKNQLWLPVVILLLLMEILSPAGLQAQRPIVSEKALRLVRPVLIQGFGLGNAPQAGKEKEKPQAKTANMPLASVLSDNSKEADEALVILMHYRLGEPFDRDISCEVIDRGSRMLALLTTYEAYVPDLGIPALPKAFLRDRDDYVKAQEWIKGGVVCNPDE